MNRLQNLALAGIVLAAALVPSRALALAGLAEHYYTYHFNRFAQLVWVSPGDLCEGSDKYCLDLSREDQRDFEGISGSLEAINVPSDSSSPYIVARKSIDDTWFVYHLGEEKFLIEGATRDEALSVWAELGLVDPTFIDSRNVDEYLEETADSFNTRWTWQIALMAMSLVFPCLLLVLVFGGLTQAFRRGHRKSGSRLKLILARVFMVPAGLAGVVLVFSVGLLVALRILGSFA
jgi:hypothetical protein